MKISIAIFVISILNAGCTLLPRPAAPVIRYYTVDIAPPPPSAEKTPYILAIMPFSIASVYSRNSIVYTREDATVGFYMNDQWIVPPEQLVTDALMKDMTSWEFFNAVVPFGTVARPHYVIGGKLTYFGEERQKTQSLARVSATLTLTRQRRMRRDGQPELVRQREYTAETPVALHSPAEVVQGLRTSLEEIFGAFRADVMRYVTEDLREEEGVGNAP